MASRARGGNSCGDFIRKLKNKRVFIKLNDGTAYAGNLICVDGNLNTVLEAVALFASIEEAQQANGLAGKATESFGEAFIRGNNICYIVPCQEGRKSKANGSRARDSSSSSGSSSSGSSSGSSSSSAANRELMIQTVNEKGL